MKTVPFAALVIASLGFAVAATTTYKLVINGQPASSSAIVVSGKTYVAVDALQKAGVSAALSNGTLTLKFPAATTTQLGGANQNAALEGCIGQWLFNGIWRFRVLGVEAFQEADRRGWRVSTEIRNGSKANAISLGGTGLTALSLVLNDGNQLEVNNITDIRDPGVAQGAGITTKLVYYADALPETTKPQKLLLLLKPSVVDAAFLKRSGAVFTTSDPSFRVNLECKR